MTADGDGDGELSLPPPFPQTRVSIDASMGTMRAPLDYSHQVSKELRAIFVHVPKTGGASIEATLSRYTRKQPFSGHVAASEYLRICPDDWSRYFKFGFVRNPWSRLVSAYYYLIDRLADEPFVRDHMLPYGEQFSRFVCEVLGRHPSAIYWVAHLKPQAYYLCDEHGSVAVDYVGRFEHLDEDWKRIRTKLRIQDDLPHSNRTRNVTRHYADYYTEAAAAVVKSVYAADIALFSYSFREE